MNRLRSTGFTLLEAIISIAILGVLGAVVAVFIRGPIDAYLDTARRAQLTDAASGVISRMSRDIQLALPNSFRGPTTPSSACFEFLPVVASGRYRTATNDSGSGNVLNFSGTDGAFDVLGHIGLDRLNGTNHVVIYNLGVPGADAYTFSPAPDNRAQIGSVSFPATPPSSGEVATVTLASAFQFPFESPGKRFHVVPNASVVYYCAAGGIWRATNALGSARMANCPTSGGTLVVSDVDCTQTAFNYDPAVTQRNGMVTIRLTLTRAGESVRLYDRVTINNAP